MPHIRLHNGAKVWVQSNAYSTDQNISQIMVDLSNYANPQTRINACKILTSLGILARDASGALETIVASASDLVMVQHALDALERIMPEKYGNVQYRHNIMHQRTTALGATATVPWNNGTVCKKTETTVTNDSKKKESQQVDIVQVECDLVSLDQEVSVTRKCSFCEKEAIATPGLQKITEHLCPPGKFFCNFCLRHNFNTKDNKHILAMTFRGIIGYFYYEFYQFPKSPQMWLSEITDFVQLHRDIGLLNPVFSYDEESYCWFIDFRRVGASKKKISMNDVCGTIIEILASFNLAHNVNGLSLHKLYAKYQEAVKDFYERRYRPMDKKLCAPTLKGCGNVSWGGGAYNPTTQNQIKMNLEDTKTFLPSMLQPEKFWKKTASL